MISEDVLREIVKKGGGIYKGIQEAVDHRDLVLFNDPETGTTLAVKMRDIGVDAVRTKILFSRSKWHLPKDQNLLPTLEVKAIKEQLESVVLRLKVLEAYMVGKINE